MCSNVFTYRKLDDGMFEMTCTLNIDSNELTPSKGKGYKYVVYSPKMAHMDDCFEYLHTFTHTQNPNRCLRINVAEVLSKSCTVALSNVISPHMHSRRRIPSV